MISQKNPGYYLDRSLYKRGPIHSRKDVYYKLGFIVHFHSRQLGLLKLEREGVWCSLACLGSTVQKVVCEQLHRFPAQPDTVVCNLRTFCRYNSKTDRTGDAGCLCRLHTIAGQSRFRFQGLIEFRQHSLWPSPPVCEPKIESLTQSA